MQTFQVARITDHNGESACLVIVDAILNRFISNSEGHILSEIHAVEGKGGRTDRKGESGLIGCGILDYVGQTDSDGSYIDTDGRCSKAAIIAYIIGFVDTAGGATIPTDFIAIIANLSAYDPRVPTNNLAVIAIHRVTSHAVAVGRDHVETVTRIAGQTDSCA